MHYFVFIRCMDTQKKNAAAAAPNKANDSNHNVADKANNIPPSISVSLSPVPIPSESSVSSFTRGDIVIYQGLEAEVMRVIDENRLEITYPSQNFIMQRPTAVVCPQDIQKKSEPFQAHMSSQDASKLKVHDKIDHRDQIGRFVYATVSEKQGTNLKIHYDGWSRKWDQ